MLAEAWIEQEQRMANQNLPELVDQLSSDNDSDSVSNDSDEEVGDMIFTLMDLLEVGTEAPVVLHQPPTQIENGQSDAAFRTEIQDRIERHGGQTREIFQNELVNSGMRRVFIEL